MKLAEKQKYCPYCHDGWFVGKSGWQHADVAYHINDDGVMETFINGVYGYCEGMKVCPFCRRPLNGGSNNE